MKRDWYGLLTVGSVYALAVIVSWGLSIGLLAVSVWVVVKILQYMGVL